VVDGRTHRILFFMYHAGYLRHYREALRLLALEGHAIHLAFTVVEKDAGDRILAEKLAEEFPGRVTFAQAPTRRYWDGWRRTSIIIRAFTDLARYIDPRYADAPALRKRMAEKIKRQIFSGRADPATTFLLTRAVDRLATRTDLPFGRRLLRLLRAAERAVPPSRRITTLMRDWRPDAVLVTPLVEYTSNQVDYLKSASALGIPTAAGIASWDNLTNKGLLRFTPDRVLVWNDIQVRELADLHGVPADRAIVTGGAKFDAWFELRPTRSADEHRRHVGLPAGRDYLLYVCSSPFIAPDEVSFVRRWIEALRASDDPAVRDLAVLVRPHPQNAAQWRDVSLGDDGAVWPRGGQQPDFEESRAGFYDSIFHSVAVVGINTSAMIDSAIVGKNVLTILDPVFSATQEGTLHFRYLLRENGGFLNVARSLSEHVTQVAAAVHGGTAEQERLRAFANSFVRPRGLDAPVAPIVAAAIRELAELGPRTRRRLESPLVYAMRGLLLLPTAAATATMLVGIVLESLTGDRLQRRRSAARERTKTA
jgi:hypothetical protein